MPGISSSLQKSCNLSEFIIVTGDVGFERMMPRLISPTNSSIYKGYGGIEANHCLYIMALSIPYKFRCEGFEDNFYKTRRFISAYFTIYSQNRNPWFKTKEQTLALKDENLFMKSFLNTLISDLESYRSHSSTELVRECKKELETLRPLI